MHARTLCIVLLCVFGIAAAFALRPSRITRRSVIDTQLFGLGDMLKGAFANDPSLPPPKNAGLSSEPISVEIEFLPSKKVVKALLGSKISDIAKVNNIAIRYSCKKGAFYPFNRENRSNIVC